MTEPVTIRQVSVERIYDLRQRLLRPGQPTDSVRFDGDDLEMTKHIALFHGEKLVGCASLMFRNSSAFDARRQYQMRGVAVEKEYQGGGYGKALVKYVEFLVLNRGADFIWLNARVDVKKFYEKLGYAAYGEEFEIRNVCRHIVMFKKLTDTACEGCKNAENKTV